MLTEGRGAAFSSFGGDAVFSESSDFSVDFSAAPSAFSVCPSLGACFSVASALPLEVFESSSFDLRDFEPVRTLGLDVRELMAFVLAACLLVTVVKSSSLFSSTTSGFWMGSDSVGAGASLVVVSATVCSSGLESGFSDSDGVLDGVGVPEAPLAACAYENVDISYESLL
jgi:hypothetical protein